MAIGTSILLFIIGASLTFGVDADLSGVDLQVIGWILMGGGIVGTVLGVIAQLRADRHQTHHHHEAAPTSRPTGRAHREQRTA